MNYFCTCSYRTMKLLCILPLLSLFSCGTIQQVSFPLNQELSCFVGSRMVMVTNAPKDAWGDMVLSDKTRRYELVYTGVDKNTIKITYRESRWRTVGTSKNNTSSWHIRDSHTQHLNYDLNKTDIIRFRNIKIQILDATPSLLKYIVLEGPQNYSSD